MKILVLGDIHARTCWLNIIEKENPDLTIFLGDYVSTHYKGITTEQQCSNLEDILNYKEANHDKVILLRGNHDMQHLGYSWAECSGYFPYVAKWMISIRDRFLNLTQWVYIKDDIVFSHAGISKDFWNYLNLGDSTKENILKINDLEPSSLFGFTPNRLSDYYGESTTQPLTWIRPSGLISSHIDNWIQVVGHTRMGKRTGNILDRFTPEYLANIEVTMPEFWVIDSLPFEYMIIEDDKKILKTYEERGVDDE